jgi:hypothetical protein
MDSIENDIENWFQSKKSFKDLCSIWTLVKSTNQFSDDVIEEIELMIAMLDFKTTVILPKKDDIRAFIEDVVYMLALCQILYK